MKNTYKYLFLFLLLLCGQTLIAQQESQLSAYLEVAAQNNPELKAAFLHYQAALEKVPQVGALPDPQATFGFLTKPMPIVGGEQVAQLNLMQMFPWFGTLSAAKDEASAMALAKFDLFNATKAELFFLVKTNWYHLFKLKAEIRLAEENLELLQSLENMALVKFQSPSADEKSSSEELSQSSEMSSSTQNRSKTTMSGGMNKQQPGLQDVLRVKMEILEQRDKLELLRDQLKTAVAGFNALLNRNTEEPVVLPDSLEQAKLSVRQEALADSIIQHNPMLAMLKNEHKSYRAMESKAEKMGLPMLGIGVNYMLNQEREGNTFMMNGKDMVMPMVSVSIPIYRKKYRAMKTEAQLLQQANVLGSIDLQNKLLVQYQSVSSDLADARRRIELYREQEQLARTTTGLLLTDFSTSGNNYEEVLRMQSKVLSYGYQRIEALTDYNSSVALAEKLMNSTSK